MILDEKISNLKKLVSESEVSIKCLEAVVSTCEEILANVKQRQIKKF